MITWDPGAAISKVKMSKNLLAPNVLLVFPRFNPNSFWSLAPVCEVWGARCPAPPLGLITLAAMLPPGWNVRLINRNSEELTPADLGWADVVMTGGMLPQQDDTLALIELAHAHAKPIVVGGPDATSSPDAYRTADFLVLGEAEGVIQDFIKAWATGADRGVFEAPKFTADVTTTPIPRFDLLKFDHYLYIGVQFSRGCPFNCEFCDIIELYGRVPRAKSNAQMLAELHALYAAGYRGHVDFVDDNLIGNKKALKRFLPELAAWQKAHRYPFEFTTEASMNLADDRELLMMLREANFIGIFVGIEKSRFGHPDRHSEEAKHTAQPRRQRTPHLCRRLICGCGFHRWLRYRAGCGGRRHDRLHRGDRHPGRHGWPAHGSAQHATHAPADA